MTETGFSSGVSFAADWPIQVSRADSGAKTFIKKRSMGPVARARGSLYFFATLLGSISPAKNTTMVVTMVLMDTALSPHSFVTATVTIEAVAICTMFVHMSRVLMALSKSSRISSAVFALPSPRSAAALMRLLEQEAKAVSLTAKKAAQNSSSTAIIHGNRLPSSILGYTSPFILN